MRGNLSGIRQPAQARRSIPACAGEPHPRRLILLAQLVYPRVCGGTSICGGDDRPLLVYPRVCGGTGCLRVACGAAGGLSPRVRGNRAAVSGRDHALRSIPACAGEPSRSSTSRSARAVYPRVCGGTSNGRSSPPTNGGLSPRVRGNHCPFRCPLPERRNEVYPRVCGGTAAEKSAQAAIEGLSPRVRGNLHDCRPIWFVTGSIPACAGEPRFSGRRAPA